MRQILGDQTFRWNADGHGEAPRWCDEISLDQCKKDIPTGEERLQEVSEALEKFQNVDTQKAELVRLRYFLGMSFKEAADILGISVSTAKRWWIFARSWLHREISG